MRRAHKNPRVFLYWQGLFTVSRIAVTKLYAATHFYSAHDTEKLIKAEGLFLVKIRRVSIQNPKGCCIFQMALVYNRVC
jgi:hypothetical protein